MVRSRVVASLVVPFVLLVGCGDDDGDTAEDPATTPSSSSGDAGPHPCDLLTQEEVQRTLDAPVTPVESDAGDGRTCVYEPGADAPSLTLTEMPADADIDTPAAGLETKELDAPGFTRVLLVVGNGRVVVAYGQTDTAIYKVDIDAGGLGDPERIATRLLPLIVG